uniref:Uncharacterized protein n=1 Tax=Anguilla anguilla TaxID=7936 RepID=A0A0E9TR92_ANGAN
MMMSKLSTAGDAGTPCTGINGRYSSDSGSSSSVCSAGKHCLYHLYSQSEF